MRLYLSLSVVFPLLCYLVIGYILKEANILDKHTTSHFNNVLFKVLFPVTLFNNIIDAKDSIFSGEGGRAFKYLIIISIFEFIIICFIAKFISNDNKRKSAFIQGVFRGNTLLFAIVIGEALLDKGQLGMLSVSAALFTAIYGVVSIAMLEIYRGNKIDFIALFKATITNPNIIATIISFVVLLLSIEIPELIMIPVKALSATITPIALIILGADLSIDSAKKDAKDICIASIIKLIIWPAIAIYLAYLLGLRNEEIVTVFAITAVPSALINYATAETMGSDGPFSAELIAISTILSIFTIFLWILILPM